MTVEYIRYKVTEEQRQEFIDAYNDASKELIASEYCKAYELAECEEEAGQFILRIEWTSTEAHMNGFRKSNIFQQFFAKVKPYFNNIQEMRHYKLTTVTHPKINKIITAVLHANVTRAMELNRLRKTAYKCIKVYLS